MHTEPLAQQGRRQGRISGHHAQGTGIDPLADAPHVQVRQARVTRFRMGFHHLTDLRHDRVVHFPVQQNHRCLGNQVPGPDGHQHCPDDTHDRIKPGPAPEQATDQRDNGQHRGGRVGQDMHIGGLEVQVVLVHGVPVVRAVVMPMAVALIVMVRLAQQQRADQVDGQTHDGHHDGFAVLNGLWRGQSLEGAKHHQGCHTQQEDRAGKAGQDLDLPGAERKPRITRIAPCRGIGEGTEPDGHGMRTHVPAIGQQGHRVEPPAREDLGHHHGGRNAHHPPGAALGGLAAVVKDVVVDECR